MNYLQHRLLIITSLLVLVFGANAALAQVSRPTAAKAETPEPVTEKLDTGLSPIHITRIAPWLGGGVGIGNKKSFDAGNVGYLMSNPSDKNIRAYAAVLTHRGSTEVRMHLCWGSSATLREANKKHLGSYIFEINDRPEWSIDWILFDDGTTWGPDKYGRSEEISEFVQGKETAVNRAKEWIGYSDTHKLRYVIEPYGGSRSWGYNPSSKSVQTMRSANYNFDQGYESVIAQLLFDAKTHNRELSKQIADWLKTQLPTDRPNR
ncbi:MAG: hypothetical protein ABIV48_08420 [Pyrinomonadaceae bacterium]